MAYSEQLANRVREVIGGRDGVSEREMFGGLCLMVGGNMAVGVMGDDLMVRLDRADAERSLTEDHVRPMDFTGRPMKGFVVVDSAGIADDGDLGRWVDTGADFAEALPPK